MTVCENRVAVAVLDGAAGIRHSLQPLLESADHGVVVADPDHRPCRATTLAAARKGRLMASHAPVESQLFTVSELVPGPAQKRLALAIVVGTLVVVYVVTVPLAGVYIGPNLSFAAAYQTAMFMTDAITATLLYAQFALLRSRATLVVASGYLFTALIMLPFFATWFDLLPAQSKLGGLHAASWLYLAWHVGFLVFVIAYALTKDQAVGRSPWPGKAHSAVLFSVVSTFVLAVAVTLAIVTWESALPVVFFDYVRFSPAWVYVIGMPIALAGLIAMALLWFRRRSVLDLWLMVVAFLFIVEQPLQFYPSPVRFSLGWYAVRAIGVLSGSIILVVMLYEITTLYPRLLGAVLGQQRERSARLATGDAVAAAVVHEIRQPLTAMVTTADAGLRFLDRTEPNVDKAKDAFKRIAGDGHRADALVVAIRANFKSGASERAAFDLNELIDEALALGDADLERHRVLVRAEPNRQLPAVRGNRLQVQQVLVNLITNAVDAMASSPGPRVLTIGTELQGDGPVRVSVADTGSGVSAPHARNIFNPQFTTKAEGMGMGLSICRAIVEAHDGRLWFEQNEPHGTVFMFTLEASAQASAAA
jgi:signal transduction histidine kinase